MNNLIREEQKINGNYLGALRCRHVGITRKGVIRDAIHEWRLKRLPTKEKNNQMSNILKLVAMKSNRGFRHTKGLPVRGQRTHSNAKTQKKKIRP